MNDEIKRQHIHNLNSAHVNVNRSVEALRSFLDERPNSALLKDGQIGRYESWKSELRKRRNSRDSLRNLSLQVMYALEDLKEAEEIADYVDIANRFDR